MRPTNGLGICMHHSEPVVVVNGEFLPQAEARLAVTDRGFRLGDGVFATIAVCEGKPYQWMFHVKQLQEGMQALAFSYRLEVDPLKPTAMALIERCGIRDGSLRVSISRGSGSQGYVPTDTARPNWVMECTPAAPIPKDVALYLSHWRKMPPACLPTAYKLAQGCNSMLARMEAQKNGCFEALMLSVEGDMAEASSANLFWIEEGRLFTPPLSTGALAGSTRHAVMRLADVEERLMRPDALREAEGVFLTNTSWGILPVARLQPHDWGWRSAEHPLILSLQAALAADRKAGHAD